MAFKTRQDCDLKLRYNFRDQGKFIVSKTHDKTALCELILIGLAISDETVQLKIHLHVRQKQSHFAVKKNSN
jgi:hypothetical protein